MKQIIGKSILLTIIFIFFLGVSETGTCITKEILPGFKDFLSLKILYNPIISPDGRFIVFSSDRSGNSDIYCINANGANLRRITSSVFEESEPDWSPYLF